jgi:hypothetical protein
VRALQVVLVAATYIAVAEKATLLHCKSLRDMQAQAHVLL